MKSSKSSRRHNFSSFKERIEATKIEPNLNLLVRPYDEVETSHFRSTLEHWAEVNLSGNFTEFFDQVNSYCQSLPQLLHHQKHIFDTLVRHIQIVYPFSLEPLLELLSQFIHDLGPDFMVYYPDALALITETILKIEPNESQNNRNSSNVLEWCFNCLAFTFKYLSKSLVSDLTTTFDALLPLLVSIKKSYLSRFSAEAMSYLIRKQPAEHLQKTIHHTFVSHGHELRSNAVYREALVVLYGEAMKGTEGALHSRSMNTLGSLIKITLTIDENREFVTLVVSKLILLLINFGSVENSNKVYNTTLQLLNAHLGQNPLQLDLITSVHFLLSLSFADSGKKNSLWNVIFSHTEKITKIANSHKEKSQTLHDSLIYLYCVMIRNTPANELMKYFKKLISGGSQLDGGKFFFALIEGSYALAQDTLKSLQVTKLIQEFLVSNENSNVVLPLSYFLMNTHNKGLSNTLTLPKNISRMALQSIKSSGNNDDELPFSCSALVIMRHITVDSEVLHVLCKKLEQIWSYNDVTPERAYAASLIINIISSNKDRLGEKSLADVFSQSCEKFDNYRTYVSFLEAFVKFINAYPSVQASEVELSNICSMLVKNLRLPNRGCRERSAHLIRLILSYIESPSSIISQVETIEQIPLTVESSRDVTLKIRNLYSAFQQEVNISELDSQIMFNYTFGLLSNKFQPCSDAVIECIPSVCNKLYSGLWEGSIEFICKSYSGQTEKSQLHEDSSVADELWFADDQRLKGNFKTIFDVHMSPYLTPLNAIIHSIREGNEEEYPSLMRTQAIKVLSAIPSFWQEHLRVLASLICKIIDGEDNDFDSSMGSPWTMKERNLFIGIIAKTKHLKKLEDKERLHAHILKLLSSRQSEGQKLALDIIFNFQDQAINKYRDHFNNLLDDSLFRDEIVTFLSADSTSVIEAPDFPQVINIALHILFGRAQRTYKSNSSMGKKHAVFQALGNLEEPEITLFLRIGSSRLDYQSYVNISHDSNITQAELRKCLGFYNLINELVEVISPSKRSSFLLIIEPIIYGLVLAQTYITRGEDKNEVEFKIAKQVRLTGLRCFASVVKFLGETAPWQNYSAVLFEKVFAPRLAAFSQENLQQPSALLSVFTSLVDYLSSRALLYHDDFHLCRAIVSLLSNKFIKGSVVLAILDFCFKSLSVKSVDDDRLFTFLAILVEGILRNLPNLILESESEEVIEKSVQLLLHLIQGNYVDDISTRSSLLDSLKHALDRSSLESGQTLLVLQAMSSILEASGFEESELWSVYDICCKRLRSTKERDQRQVLLNIFVEIGTKLDDVRLTTELLKKMNAFKATRNEPDFDQRLLAFREVNEVLYPDLNVRQWMPFIYCALYYINDESELTMRTNGSFLLCRFVDCFSKKSTAEESTPYIHVLKDVILPHIRSGLRNRNADVQSEHVTFLAYLIENARYYTDLDDMKVLLFNNDEEANFFRNINHIQIHRRQRAIMRIRDYREQLTSSSIAHYILPMIEYYSVTDDERMRNVSNESIKTISLLARRLSWTQFRAVLSRYLSLLKGRKEELLGVHVSLVVALSEAALGAIENFRSGILTDTFANIPSQEIIDSSFSTDVLPIIIKVLSTRNDETIVSRIQLGEGVVNLLMCISDSLRNIHLTSALTSLCQVLRSRSEELRDAVRKSLGRILVQLGSDYLLFFCKELKTALSRGSQIHVLSFTLHFLITSLSSHLQPGSLDESCRMIVEIIMEDIFGAAGQEKDAEGYHSKMKEVKHKKSFDTAEILASFVSLTQFDTILDPVKLILRENASLNVQKKIDELLRRYALGLNHNEEANSKNVLLLSYEIFSQSLEQVDSATKAVSQSQSHFMVNLDKNSKKMDVDRTFFVSTTQRFALEMFRTAVTRNEELRTVGNVKGFLPYLNHAVSFSSDQSAISAFKVLMLLVRLPFDQEELDILKLAFRKAIANIKNSPTITSELSQVCLRFLASIVRHRPEIQVKDNTIGYLLTRILPSLEESTSQGNAFNFVKAVVAQHILIPEVYDIMGNISKIMVVNHHRDVRNMARSVYLLFLMEYDQGKGKLQKEFKFLVNNLGYPTEEGRQSVMELLNSIVIKAGTVLIDSLASSFFVVLSNVTINDESRLCREMAASILKNLLGKASKETLQTLETYCFAWMNQKSNTMLLRCGLNVYNIYIDEFGFNFNAKLDDLAIGNIDTLLKEGENKDGSSTQHAEWEDIYSLLVTFSSVAQSNSKGIFTKRFEGLWKKVFSVLLYPHSWVRLVASRLVGMYLARRDEAEINVTSYETQTIAYRLLRQLSAPSITEELGEYAMNNLLLITLQWQENSTPYEILEEREGETRYALATDFVLARICGLLRQDANQQDFVTSKKISLKLLKILSEKVSVKYLLEQSETIILALVNLIDLLSTNDSDETLRNLSQECLEVIESRLGVSDYTAVYARVQNIISQRRQDRKVKRAQTAIIAPDAFAKRKLRKHERFREKRKHEKDENGYYKPKKRRTGV